MGAVGLLETGETLACFGCDEIGQPNSHFSFQSDESVSLIFPTILDALFTAPGTARITIDAGDHGPRIEMSHAELLALGIQTAHRLVSWGVTPGDRVVLLLSTGLPLLRGVLGAWLCGGIPVILPEAIGASRSDLHLKRLRGILCRLSPRLVVIPARLQDCLDWTNEFPEIRLILRRQIVAPSGETPREPPYRPSGDEIALLQFSSGSTGEPKCVIIRHAQMVHNLIGWATRAQITANGPDRMLSWAPLHHDMGVNSVILTLFLGIDLVLIPTESFSRSPHIWLQRLSETHATLCTGTPSAYRILCRLAPSRHLASIDLSSWRDVSMGAEPVYPEHLNDFIRAYANRGLHEQALRPGYGMAETVLVTTMLPPEESALRLYVDRDRLSADGEVVIVAPDHPRALGLMACGYPLDEMELRIVDSQGKMLAENYQGHIQVRGPSVTEGYWGEQPRASEDWLDTGDLGFLHRGQVVISGRAKDLIIRGGRNFAAHDLEWAINEAEPAWIKRSAVFSVLTGNVRGEKIVAVVELKCPKCSPEELLELEVSIRDNVAQQTDVQLDHVEIVPPGTIPRTTSGKIQRGLTRERFLVGTLLSSVEITPEAAP
ncbi:putative Long-chain-fatty-acid--CoA ligase [Gammaproteobacteria bacterium]